jgi:hypothetical protein
MSATARRSPSWRSFSLGVLLAFASGRLPLQSTSASAQAHSALRSTSNAPKDLTNDEDISQRLSTSDATKDLTNDEDISQRLSTSDAAKGLASNEDTSQQMLSKQELTAEAWRALQRRYAHEPSVQQVVAAALRAGTGRPKQLTDLAQRARLRGLLQIGRAHV